MNAEDKDQTKLRLSWETLKEILRIDEGVVRLKWDEFQALISRTDQKAPPMFSVSGGEVLLSQDEFKRLIDRLVPPTPAPPSIQFTKAFYKGRVQGESVVLSATIEAHARNKAGKDLQVDLFPSGPAFEEVLVDGKPAHVEEQGGRLYLTTNKDGRFQVELKFSAKNPLTKGAQEIFFPIPRTPITQIQLELPEHPLEVSVSQALRTETQAAPGGTLVTAILPPCQQVQLAWYLIAPETSKGPAKVYAEADHLLSLDEDALKAVSTLNLNVLQNTINTLTVEMPRGFDVTAIQGDFVGNWREIPGSPDRIQIPFKVARKGSFQISITSERLLTERKALPTFTGLKVQGTVRQRGNLAVELPSQAEVLVGKHLGLEQTDIQDVSPQLFSLSQRPLLYAFKFFDDPYELELKIERHPDVRLLTSLIDLASGVTLLMPDGRLLHQMTYRVRNSWKQFLEVSLPEGNRLWSVFVAGLPVKPSKKSGGQILIPLNRSQNINGNLSPFDVDLIYYEEGPKLLPLGRQEFQFPVPDILVNRILWSVYLPPDQKYLYLSKDFEGLDHRPKIPMPVASAAGAGFKPAPAWDQPETEGHDQEKGQIVEESDGMRGNRRDIFWQKENRAGSVEMDADKASGRPQEDQGDEGYLSYQRQSEQKLLSIVGERNGEPPKKPAPPQSVAGGAQGWERGEVAGVLPIRMRVPVTGQVRRFSKILLDKGRPVPLTLFHISCKVIELINWFMLGLAAIWLIRMRSKITVILHQAWNHLPPLKVRLAPLVTPFGLVVTAAAASLLFSYLSLGWLALALLAYLAAVARWLMVVIDILPEVSHERD